MVQTKYTQYVASLLENSKNDAIPEISRETSKFAIILFGPPAAGKSTFIRNYIGQNFTKPVPAAELKRIRDNRSKMLYDRRALPHVESYLRTPSGNQFKVINSDDINYWRTNDENVWDKRATPIRDKQLAAIIDNGTNFIYDTTGMSLNRIDTAMTTLRKHGYKVIFVQLLADMFTGLKRNAARERSVPNVYLLRTYMKIPAMIEKFDELEPDNYYFVFHNGVNYDFFRYRDHQYSHRDARGAYQPCGNPIEELLGQDKKTKDDIHHWLKNFSKDVVYQRPQRAQPVAEVA